MNNPLPILQPSHSEEGDQILLVNWFSRTHPELAPKLHHSPNGGYRDKRTGHRMKLMGTKPGFHDLVLFHPVGPHTGLALELKLGAGRLTQSQEAWIPIYRGCGFATASCWGFEAGREAITRYLAGNGLPENTHERATP